MFVLKLTDASGVGTPLTAEESTRLLVLSLQRTRQLKQHALMVRIDF